MRIWCISFVVLCVLGTAQEAWAQYGDISDLPIAKPEDKVDIKSTPAPEGAIILFDGKNLDNWTKTDGKTPARWKLLDNGVLEVKPGERDIITRDKFDGYFKLHVEFRVPYMPDAKG